MDFRLVEFSRIDWLVEFNRNYVDRTPGSANCVIQTDQLLNRVCLCLSAVLQVGYQLLPCFKERLKFGFPRIVTFKAKFDCNFIRTYRLVHQQQLRVIASVSGQCIFDFPSCLDHRLLIGVKSLATLRLTNFNIRCDPIETSGVPANRRVGSQFQQTRLEHTGYFLSACGNGTQQG